MEDFGSYDSVTCLAPHFRLRSEISATLSRLAFRCLAASSMSIFNFGVLRGSSK